MRFLLFLTVLALFAACQTPTPGTETSEPSAGGEELGKLDQRLSEVSGMVASRKNEGLLWAHNDSGNPAELFLIDLKGNVSATYALEGLHNRDWEDISAGPGPEPGEKYLYVGDIGDNEAKRPIKHIYRLIEPEFDAEDTRVTLTDFDTLFVRLPDQTKDTEALAVDPKTGDILIFSKRLPINRVYRLQSGQIGTDTLIFEIVGEIGYKNIVAADFSPDGDELLVKTYSEVLYWERDSLESVEEMLRRPGSLLKYEPEPQGESIAWSLDGKGYYTSSEFSNNVREPLRYYRKAQQ